MIDETLKTLLAIRTWVTKSAVSPEGPDEIRIYIMIGKTAMVVDTMSTMLPITTPFREIRFIFVPPFPNDAPTMRTMTGPRKRREGLQRVVCHERGRSTRLRATVREMKEGPSGSVIRSLIPSHREPLRSKAVVVSVAETPGQWSRQARSREASATGRSPNVQRKAAVFAR